MATVKKTLTGGTDWLLRDSSIRFTVLVNFSKN